MLTWTYETACVLLLPKDPPVACTRFEAESPDMWSFREFPDVILCMLLDHTKLRDALALNCTCRSINDAIRSTCRERMTVQFERIVSHFPTHAQDSLPMSVWLDLEWVKFCAEWMGSTGYIDGVRPKDIPGHPFKCCRDSYGRLMVLMRRKKMSRFYFNDTQTIRAYGRLHRRHSRSEVEPVEG